MPAAAAVTPVAAGWTGYCSHYGAVVTVELTGGVPGADHTASPWLGGTRVEFRAGTAGNATADLGGVIGDGTTARGTPPSPSRARI